MRGMEFFLLKSPCLHLSGAVPRKLGNRTLNGSENNSGHGVTLGLGAEPVPIFLLLNIEPSQKKDYLICLLSFKLAVHWNRFSLLITEHHIDCLWRDWQTSILVDEQPKGGMSGASR